MKYLNPYCRCLLLAILFLPSLAFGRSEKWDDEALLHDGRTVEVHRTVTYHFPDNGELSQLLTRFPDQYSLEAQNPDTGKKVKWTGERYVYPIMLDFVDRVPYLVVFSSKVFSNTKLYGCPEIPYVFVKYDENKGKWSPIARDQAPKVLRTANLSEDSRYARSGKRQTKEFISGRYRSRLRADKEDLTADIPESYESWNFRLKEQRYRNVRFENDCRSSLAEPVETINPKNPVPASKHVDLEILESKVYDPIWIIKKDPNEGISKWASLTADMKRLKACEPLFQPAYPNYPQLSMWKSFTKDASRKNITAYTTHRICDSDAIWFWDYVAEPNRVVIIKLDLAGDVIYRISFAKPQGYWGYEGHIMTPTLKTENGYLYFDWWNTKQSVSDRHVKRAMKVRLREPH